MGRLTNIPSGNGSVNPSAPFVDSTDNGSGLIGFSAQNVGAVDVYISEDRTRLDATAPGTNLPQVGILLTAAQQAIWVVPRCHGIKFYIRAQNPGAQVEVIEYPIC